MTGLSSLRRSAAAFAAGITGIVWAATASATQLMGQPTPGGMGLQPAASPLKVDAIAFHDHILLPIITGISILVLGLLLWCIVRFNKRTNPVPAKFTHNTTIEIVWTLVPVLILMFIAIFSFKLLFAYNNMPKPYMTVKATGYQWYWGYEYPDQKISEITSAVLPESDAKARNVPFRLAATEPMIVPVNQVVRVQVTGADVIHSFAMPAFGLKTDGIPGRLNETWFRADRTGTFYGQCSELCGVDHAFMPIEIKVVSQAEFDAWVAAKGPKPAAVTAEAAPAAAAPAAPSTAPAAPAAPAV